MRAYVARLRRANPDAVLVMAGCYARTSPESRAEIPEVDHWIGPGAAESVEYIPHFPMEWLRKTGF